MSLPLRAVGQLPRSRTLPGTLSQWRGFASVGKAQEVDKLPLSGLRVLDMTRVLAGVGLTDMARKE